MKGRRDDTIAALAVRVKRFPPGDAYPRVEMASERSESGRARVARLRREHALGMWDVLEERPAGEQRFRLVRDNRRGA